MRRPLKNFKPCHYYFGERTWYSKFHLGQDLNAYYRAVYAPVNGIILRTGIGKAGGKYVHFQGDDGKYHRFLHLSEIKKHRKETVVEGQIIAKTGNTGWSKSPHLHWDVWIKDPVIGYNEVLDGNYTSLINPLEYIKNVKPNLMENDFVKRRDDQWVSQPSGDCIIINNKNATFIRFNKTNSSELERRQFHLSTIGANFVSEDKIKSVTKGKKQVSRLAEL